MSRFLGKKIDNNWTALCKGFVFDKEGCVCFDDYQFEYGFYRFIYRRDFLLENNLTFPTYSRYQDTLFMANAIHCAGKFYALPKTVYNYNIKNALNEWDECKVIDYLDAVLEMIEFAKFHKYNVLAKNTLLRINDFVPNFVKFLTVEEVKIRIIKILNQAKDFFSLEEYCYFCFLKLGNEIRDGIHREKSLKSSMSYKLGRAIVALPHKIKELFTKIIRGSR